MHLNQAVNFIALYIIYYAIVIQKCIHIEATA